MTPPGTHVTKGLLLLLQDQGDFLPVEVVPTASLPVTSGLADPLILVKLEMLVRHPPIWALFEPLRLISRLVLADADPLGVNQNVTFQEVGGLDDRKLVVYAQTLLLNSPKISTL